MEKFNPQTNIVKKFKNNDAQAGDLFMNYEITNDYKGAIEFLAYLKGQSEVDNNSMEQLKEKDERFNREFLLDKYLDQYMDNVKKYYQSHYKSNTNRDYNDSDLNKEVEKFDKKRLNNIINNYIDLSNNKLTKTKKGGTAEKMTLTEYECVMNILADFNDMLREAKKEPNINENNSFISLRQSFIQEARNFNAKTEINKISKLKEKAHLNQSVMPNINLNLNTQINKPKNEINNNINIDKSGIFDNMISSINVENKKDIYVENKEKLEKNLNKKTSVNKRNDDYSQDNINKNLNIEKETETFKKIDVKKKTNKIRESQIFDNDDMKQGNKTVMINPKTTTNYIEFNPRTKINTKIKKKKINLNLNENKASQSMMLPKTNEIEDKKEDKKEDPKIEVKFSKKNVNDKKNNINNQK